MKTSPRAIICAAVLASALGTQAFAAIPTNDQFEYTADVPVPGPWSWYVQGSSTNQVTVSNGNKVLRTDYSGSGLYSLTRTDVNSNDAVYSIDFWDDGTQNYGILFYLQLSDGTMAGIGVNDSIAPGSYYFRTAAHSNTGPTMAATRTGMFWNNNWHLFQLYISYKSGYGPSGGGGVLAMVDGGPSASVDLGADVSVASVGIMGNWNKPASTAYFDNFRVRPTGYVSRLKYAPDVCSATAGTISVGTDMYGRYLYNPSTSTPALVDCVVPSEYMNGYSKFGASFWWMADNYDQSTGQVNVPSNWNARDSVLTPYQGSAVSAGSFPATNWKESLGVVGPLYWPTSSGFGPVFDGYPAVFLCVPSSTLHMQGRIMPKTSSGVSKLYAVGYYLAP